jgi:hypothetical protein
MGAKLGNERSFILLACRIFLILNEDLVFNGV